MYEYARLLARTRTYVHRCVRTYVYVGPSEKGETDTIQRANNPSSRCRLLHFAQGMNMYMYMYKYKYNYKYVDR